MQKANTFRELKNNARYQMQGRLGTLIGAMLLEFIIVYVLNNLASSLIQVTDIVSNIIYLVAVFIIDLLSGTLIAGLAYLHLKTACRMDVKVSDLFHVVKNHPDRAIKLQLVLTLINTVFLIPDYIYSAKFGNAIFNCYYNAMQNFAIYRDEAAILEASKQILNIVESDISTFFILNCLIIVFGILSIIVRIGFFPVFYMMLDFPNMPARNILKKSWKLMRGNKAKYFLLNLSFIGYFILSLFTMMIPMIWVIPYMQMTGTNFYLNLVAFNDNEDGNSNDAAAKADNSNVYPEQNNI